MIEQLCSWSNCICQVIEPEFRERETVQDDLWGSALRGRTHKSKYLGPQEDVLGLGKSLQKCESAYSGHSLIIGVVFVGDIDGG